MRRVVVLALLALALPIAAWADNIDITNQYGTVAISYMPGTGGMGTIGSTTITSHGSQMTSWNSYTGHLGFVGFATGTLASGSVVNGGVFNGGGYFNITGVGAWASGLTGLSCGSGCSMFAGSFNGPVTWTLISQVKNDRTYTLTGTIEGTLYTGRLVHGTTIQDISILNGTQLNQGRGHINMGGTTILTPEPGTLGLLGTGLVAVAGMFRRKLIKG